MSLKIHPLLEAWLIKVAEPGGYNFGTQFQEWLKAGKPICEEATAKPLPVVEEEPPFWSIVNRKAHCELDQEFVDYWFNRMNDAGLAKDAKIAELVAQRDGAIQKIAELEAKIRTMNPAACDCIASYDSGEKAGWNAALEAVMEKVVGVVGSESDRIRGLKK